MSKLKSLYADLIIDHNKNPRNIGVIDNFTHTAIGNNTLCGDKITIFLNIQNNVVIDIKFEGSGCAIFVASASMMTQHLKGKSVQECETIFEQFQNLVTVDVANANLGKLQAFAGVKEYPVRVKCVTLPWRTLISALAQPSSVSTK